MVSPTPSPLCNGVFHMVLTGFIPQRCFEMVESATSWADTRAILWKKTLKLRCFEG